MKTPSLSFAEMSFIDHLADLRLRVLKALASWLVMTAVCYYYSQEIINFLVQPLARCLAFKGGRHLIYTDLSEAFITHLKVACVTGIMAAFPFISAQGWFFIAPGLYKNEKKIFLIFLTVSPLLFIIGMAMAYWGIFPLAWSFFLSFQDSSAFSPFLFSSEVLPLDLEPRVSSYLDLALSLMITFGLCFQLPLFLLLLARLKMVKMVQLQKYRRHAILGIFIVSAFVTPPDVLSQIMLAVPLIGLYELSILLVRFFCSYGTQEP